MVKFMRHMFYVSFYFFLSSRRRHTRYIGDWSSDVCSSDLPNIPLCRSLPFIVSERQSGMFGLLHALESVATLLLMCDRRSEERRVGKECRSRWRLDTENKKWSSLRWKRFV